MGDRRKNERLTCSRFACSCSLKSESTAEFGHETEKAGAILLDICPGGVCLESNFKPPAEALMFFKIRPIEGPELDAKVRVRHIRKSSAKGFHVIGSMFEELTEDNRQNLLTLLQMVSRLENDLRD